MDRACSSESRVCIYGEQDRECVCGQEKENRSGNCEECPGFEDQDNDGICDHHDRENLSEDIHGSRNHGKHMKRNGSGKKGRCSR